MVHSGPLVYIKIVGQGAVILNSHRVATTLLEGRKSIYSDRPRFAG